MKVLLTHSEGKLEGLEPMLASLKLNVVHRPLIKVSFINSKKTLNEAIELLKLPWLFFTSRSAIEAWHELTLPFNNKIAVVGQASAKTLAKYAKSPELIAENQNAEGLLSAFLKHKDKSCPVGVVKGNLSLKTLEKGLNEENCQTKTVEVYKTETLEIDETADIVFLASPSAVKALPKKLSKAILVAIGPSTANALKEKNLSYQLAAGPDVKSIFKTIEGII